MTPGRHVTLPLLVILAILAAAFLGVVLWLLLPRERPADIPPTPIIVTTTPVSAPAPLVPAPTVTPVPPEPILLTPVMIPAPTRTLVPTSTATPEPTKKPPEEMRQRG